MGPDSSCNSMQTGHSPTITLGPAPQQGRQATAAMIRKLSITGVWIRDTEPNTFNQGRKKKKNTKGRKERRRKGDTNSVLHLSKKSLLSQMPVEALRNQDKDTGLRKLKSWRG